MGRKTWRSIAGTADSIDLATGLRVIYNKGANFRRSDMYNEACWWLGDRAALRDTLQRITATIRGIHPILPAKDQVKYTPTDPYLRWHHVFHLSRPAFEAVMLLARV